MLPDAVWSTGRFFLTDVGGAFVTRAEAEPWLRGPERLIGIVLDGKVDAAPYANDWERACVRYLGRETARRPRRGANDNAERPPDALRRLVVWERGRARVVRPKPRLRLVR